MTSHILVGGLRRLRKKAFRRLRKQKISISKGPPSGFSFHDQKLYADNAYCRFDAGADNT